MHTGLNSAPSPAIHIPSEARMWESLHVKLGWGEVMLGSVQWLAPLWGNGDLDANTDKDGHVNMKTENEMTLPWVKNHWQPPKARRGKEGFFLRAFKGNTARMTLDLDS